MTGSLVSNPGYLWLIGAYMVGAVPTGYLAGRYLRGIDLRQFGSGNLGATNVFRTLGTAPAVAVLLVDIFKGFAPVFWIPSLTGLSSPAGEHVVVFRLLLGLAAISGHVFSPFVKFKGGKGVATAAGVFLALVPKALGICVLVWVLLMAAFRIVSVASIGAAFALPLAIFLTTSGQAADSWLFRSFGILIGLVVIYNHRSNIARLLRGEEKRLSRGRDREEKS